MDCSDSESADSFHGAAGAMGILLDSDRTPIPQAKYNEITYYPVFSRPEAIEKIEQITADPKVKHINGIPCSDTKGAVNRPFNE